LVEARRLAAVDAEKRNNLNKSKAKEEATKQEEWKRPTSAGLEEGARRSV